MISERLVLAFSAKKASSLAGCQSKIEAKHFMLYVKHIPGSISKNQTSWQ